jgi:DsbC/DsbD-like thiol-disulfide interchange protein
LTCSRAPGTHSPVSVKLVAPRPEIAPGKSMEIAVVIDLEKGWHTYWYNPGDAGLPPDFEWTLPTAMSVEPLRLPVPTRIKEEGSIAFGYFGRVVIPSRLTLSGEFTAETTLPIVLRVDILVCKETCVPYSDSVTLDLKVIGSRSSTPGQTATADMIEKGAHGIPDSVSHQGTWTISRDRLVIQSSLQPLEDLTDLEFFPQTRGIFDYETPPAITRDSVLTITLELSPLRSALPDTIIGLVAGTRGSARRGVYLSSLRRAQ